ncbi:hypothetical protein ACS83_02755 [Vibrio alginolyticus]|uniref:hypothetical protein n=1 Tax=Vibrio alginolyticus TaxID=663 RepID=UPI0006A6198A|nr:hypothetical protein [Vibrio alginolyticus]KOE07661.1 hypothetical protein ACS83_02755 [Vibrio alginolyticus]
MRQLILIIACILSGCSSVQSNVSNNKADIEQENIGNFSRVAGAAAACTEFGYPQYKAVHIIKLALGTGRFDADIARDQLDKISENNIVAQSFCDDIQETLDDVAKVALNWRERNDKAYRAEQHAQYYNLSYQCLMPLGTRIGREDVRRYLLDKYGPITEEDLDVATVMNCDDYHALFSKVGLWVQSNVKEESYPFLSQEGLESVGNAIEPKPLRPMTPFPQPMTIQQIPGSHVIRIQQ